MHEVAAVEFDDFSQAMELFIRPTMRSPRPSPKKAPHQRPLVEQKIKPCVTNRKFFCETQTYTNPNSDITSEDSNEFSDSKSDYFG